MRHLVKGRKLTRTSSHKKALMRNMATSLFEHKKISTTEAKAKELRPYAEHLITKAKRALQKEKQGLLPDGQTVDIHNRRVVYKHITKKAVVQELFDTIAPMIADRPGGYTRIIKTGQRRGDGSRTAIIELVDWSAPQDGAASFKAKKKAKVKAKKEKTVKAQKHEEEVHADVVETPVNVVEEAVIEETVEVVDASPADETVNEASPAAEAPAAEEGEIKE